MFFVLQQVPIYDYTQDNVAHCKCATQDKWHIQQEGSWLRWIVTEQVKCK